jgi:uncharacterized protein YcnI
MKRLLAVPSVVLAALAFAASAFAHAEISPPIALANHLQLFTLAVPTEKENAVTTMIEFTPPSGFNIDSFVPSPGWKRTLQQTGSGNSAVVTKVTWSGGHTPTEEDSLFQFLASTSSAKTYTFGVRQTYSDGSVVDWNGPESSDAPAPTVESKSSFGGGTSTLEIVAVILGGLALVIAIVALVTGRGGGRSLA